MGVCSDMGICFGDGRIDEQCAAGGDAGGQDEHGIEADGVDHRAAQGIAQRRAQRIQRGGHRLPLGRIGRGDALTDEIIQRGIEEAVGAGLQELDEIDGADARREHEQHSPLDEQLAAFLQPCRQLNGYIIGSGEEPITETTFKRMWERIKKKINPYGATPHVFRHTYITLAASSGMDVKTLQSIAGHSDIKMTLDRYAHKREESIIAAGGLIREVFRSM